MRDGIYKNPALSTPWRAFMRSCTLDAERGEIAREKCERAIILELHALPPQFRASFLEKARDAESLLSGFKAFDAEVTATGLGGQNSPLENRMLAHAQRLESAGVKGCELVAEACAAALQETMSANKRLIEQTILASGSDSDSRATVMAVRNAVDSVAIRAIVESFLSGSLHRPPAHRPINLDEDLSRLNR